MLTAIDKLLAALITSGLLALNHKYGFQFATDPASVATIDGLIMSVVVWAVPNKAAS